MASESPPPSLMQRLLVNRRFMLFSCLCLCLASFLGLWYTSATLLGPLHAWSSLASSMLSGWPKQKTTHHDHANKNYPIGTNSTTVYGQLRDNGLIPGTKNHTDTLGIASRIFVVSLPRRIDRREQMEILRTALGSRWVYVDAVESRSFSIQKIMDRVRSLREGSIAIKTAANVPDAIMSTATMATFRWPQDIDALSSSMQPLSFAGSELWTSSPIDVTKTDTPFATGGLSAKMVANLLTASAMTCATDDNIIPPLTRGLPEYKILTLAKIACWSSHLSVIRRIVDGGVTTDTAAEDDVSVILEDDVDMEWDIRERLVGVWNALPGGWDVVFLGHCWSNESYYPALNPENEGTGTNTSVLDFGTPTRLHPSFGPKCTHAYALSRSGARRLLLHLRYPQFAYSRALDQAFAWLVQSGRLRAYSVVPSVIVQRKVGGSDVMHGLDGIGSGWREGLVRGVFGT